MKTCVLFLHRQQSFKYHKEAIANADAFMSIMKGEMKDVVCQNVEYAKEQIKINKQVLLSIMKTVLLCGKQGLALRGSNDDGVLGDDNHSTVN